MVFINYVVKSSVFSIKSFTAWPIYFLFFLGQWQLKYRHSRLSNIKSKEEKKLSLSF